MLKYSLTAIRSESDQWFHFGFNFVQNCLPFLPIISMGIIDEAITPINSNGMVYAAYVVCSTDATASIESQIGSLMFHFILA